MTDTTGRAILITSHVNSRPAGCRLLESLEKCRGAEALDVIVVEGGHEEPGIIAHRDRLPFARHTHVRADHNSIDFTGLIACLENPELRRDSYFYVHNTCEAGPGFVENATRVAPGADTASFEFHSMNMGVYSWRALQRHRELILSFKNPDLGPEAAARAKARCVEAEDAVFRANEDLGFHAFIGREDPTVDRDEEVYGNGVIRRVKYYPCVDLWKYQANWINRGDGKFELGL